MAAPLILRIISDVSQTLRANESVISSNTLVGKSALGMGADFEKAAAAQVASGAKVIQAQRAMVAELTAARSQQVAGSDAQIAATVALERAQMKLNNSLGISTIATGRAGAGAKTAEHDLGKLTRGALAGSGVISSLGRSLAFASGGFIAVAGSATLLHNAIADALSYAATQRKVEAQLKTSGLTFATYKGQIEDALTSESRLSGFTRQDLLQSFGYLVRVSGNVQQSLHLDAIAADVARGRNIALSSASLALAKALGGSSTALRRLGIIVPKTLHGLDAINFVAKKFAGQAEAGATSADHLHASLATASETIGTALLPTFNRLVTEFSNWITKMEQSGRLQRDAETAFHDLGVALHLVGDLIREVDKVTGSFKNTVAVLIGLEFVSKINKWTGGLAKLIGAGGVEGGGMVGADAAAVGLLARLGALATIGQIVIPVVISEEIIHSGTFKSAQKSIKKSSGPFGDIFDTLPQAFEQEIARGNRIVKYFTPGNTNPSNPVGIPVTGPQLPTSIQNALNSFMPPSTAKGGGGPLAGLKKFSQYVKKFQLGFTLMLEQANAGLTLSTADDVTVAQKIIATIKSLRGQGRLHGQALLQAIALEAQALGVLQAAAAARAQKTADAAQKASDAITAAIDPAVLELQLSKDTARGRNIVPDLKRLRAAAQKVIASGQGTVDQQNQAWQQIINLNQQIKDAIASQGEAFAIPLRLQLQQAKDEALGRSITRDLIAMRTVAQKALKSGHLGLQAQIDAWNEIKNINDQLAQAGGTAKTEFAKSSVDQLVKGLSLSPAATRALKARLSQVGYGGTVPSGAYSTSTGGGGGAGARGDVVVHTTFKLDGRTVATNTTRHQQKQRRRNPPQKRGPHADA